MCISLSTVVLNSRDRYEKTWHPTFTRLHNSPHNILFTKNRLKSICNTITKLYLCYKLHGKPNNTISTERDLKISKSTRISSDCRPAVRPTSTRSMAPDFSHNKLEEIVSDLRNCCSAEDSSTAP